MDSGKEIASFQEVMHIAVTALVVILSVASLGCLIANGFSGLEGRDNVQALYRNAKEAIPGGA